MATLLRNMQITHISLVKNPANRETVIWKYDYRLVSGVLI